jgi:2'-5' RNA ligase
VAARTPQRESAIVVSVPEAGPLVDGWRLRHAADAPLGVPAHVTLLYPFVAADAIDEEVVRALREVVSRFAAFDFALARVDRFPDVAYLAPEPAEPFRRLTEALAERWPEHPPYGGIHESVVPHLTVAHGDRRLQDEVEREVAPGLPIRATAREALLLEQLPSRRWRTRAALPLAG